jgi:hypothetical protein
MSPKPSARVFKKFSLKGRGGLEDRREADYLRDGREPELTRSTDLIRPDRHHPLCWRDVGSCEFEPVLRKL